MPLLHDPAVRDSIRTRIKALQPDSTRKWGKMTADQMLWHCNEALEAALGRRPAMAEMKVPLPKPLVKFMVISLPWIKGAPTHPDFVAGERHAFDTEKARTLSLIDEFTTKPVDGAWPHHFGFGSMTGSDYSRLHAKHLDHHLKQFSA